MLLKEIYYNNTTSFAKIKSVNQIKFIREESGNVRLERQHSLLVSSDSHGDWNGCFPEEA